WSKIAKHLPGRTDNEIKNFWRTRIQKHIKQPETFPGQLPTDQMNIDHHQASTSQMCGMTADMVTYSPPATNFQADHHVEALQAPPNNLNVESDESYWSMEDLWSMQLLNGD
ncbi:hypothetical protein CRG98_000489, partial [Punica granatum]